MTELQTELGREKERASVRNIKNEIIVENECRVNKIQLSELRIDTNLSIETLGPSPIVKVYLGCRWVRGGLLIQHVNMLTCWHDDNNLRWHDGIQVSERAAADSRARLQALTTRWNIYLSQVEVKSESGIWKVKSPHNKVKHSSLSSWDNKWKWNLKCEKPRQQGETFISLKLRWKVKSLLSWATKILVR